MSAAMDPFQRFAELEDRVHNLEHALLTMVDAFDKVGETLKEFQGHAKALSDGLLRVAKDQQLMAANASALQEVVTDLARRINE